MKGEFVWDDVFFTKRQEMQSISYIPKLWVESVLPDKQASGLYRPFTMTTFSLNLATGGLSPFSFHLVSILLNGAVTFMVAVVIFTLFRRKDLAIFTALLFAFLPIHTEAIALMKARDELLSGLFILLSWRFFLKSHNDEGKVIPKQFLLSTLFFTLGLFSKEFTVVAPVLFYLVYLIQHGIHPLGQRIKSVLLGLLFFGVPVLGYLLLRSIAIPETSFGNDDISPISNILVVAPFLTDVFTAFKILFIYVSKIIFPMDLTASYHFKAVTLVVDFFSSWRAVAGLGILTSLVTLISLRRTRTTPIGVGALIFLILYIPVSQFIFKGGDIMGERWMYVPSIGIALILAGIFTFFYQYKKVLSTIFGIFILIIYGGVTISRNTVWQNEEKLFTSMIEDSPRSVRGYSALAQHYFERGKYDEAARLVKQGLAISNQEPNLYVIGASLAYKQNKYDDAEVMIRKALEVDTFSSAAILNFPRILFAQGKYEEARLWYNEYISQLPPSSVRFQERLLYASILTKLGRYKQSTEYINKEFSSDDVTHHDVLMLISVNAYYNGNTNEALKFFPDEKGLSNSQKINMIKNFVIVP